MVLGIRLQQRPAVFFTLVVLAGAGCYPTYAPPVRFFTPGSPRVIRPFEYEARYATLGYPNHLSLSLGLDGDASVDLGLEFLVVSAMAFSGLRIALPIQPFLVADLELGGGIGLGGAKCGNQDDEMTQSCQWDRREDFDRLAGGVYAGGGIRLGKDEFSFFLRTRAQLTDATGVPMTFWFLGVAGFQVTLWSRISIHAGLGYGRYSNSVEANDSPIIDLGLALRFGSSPDRSLPVSGEKAAQRAAADQTPLFSFEELDPSCKGLESGQISVAVRFIEDPGQKLSLELRDDLSRALYSRLLEDVRSAGSGQKVRIFRAGASGVPDCTAENCPIDWGEAPGTRLVLGPVFLREAGACRIGAVLSDLDRKEKCGFSTTVGCAFADILDGARRLSAWFAGTVGRQTNQSL
jgi:hypothetical protein